MKKLLLAFAFLCCFTSIKAKDWVQYVNPLVGTQSTFELSTGNTYPAIARPWGMNFWTPQTGKMGDGWQYVYTANKIRGFKQTHQPSPWINDYGQFSIMPVTGQPVFDEDKRASWFSHKGEIALPHYYKVYLAEHDVVTEFTPTERAVLFRFTFPENEHSYVVVDAFDRGSYIRIVPEKNRIIGYSTRNSGGVPQNFRNYFIVEFDKPFTYTASVKDSVIQESQKEQQAAHAGAIIGFKTKKGEIVHARVASLLSATNRLSGTCSNWVRTVLTRWCRKDVMLGTMCWARLKWRAETSTNTALSIPACTARCFSPVLFTSWTSRVLPFTTAPIMGKCFPAICTPIRVSGIHSVVCFLSLI